jgi:serine/threonine protein kinase/Tol biopolymer transport system component
MPLTSGTRLHAYQITGPIGAGGMGEVYRAHDARLGRDVAIKVLPASVAGDPAALARFEREAKAIGALNHPNVVNVFDTGTEHPSTGSGQAAIHFVVMELLEGETLRARMHGAASPTPGGGKPAAPGSSGAKRVGLPKKKVFDIAQQIAQGLAAAHARGLVHRDLKPENIFLTTDGRVKILDFGLARPVPDAVQRLGDAETQVSPRTTDSVPGLVLGTVGYMAPEQVRGQAVDHRADIFAFGTVLFEMLTGERAFDGESPIEAMGAILKEDPLEKPAAAVAISGPIEPLLRHCLEKQPDERFQSARDLAFQLQAIASGTMTTTSAERAVGQRSGTPRWLVPAIAALALAAGAAAGYFARREPAVETLALAITLPDGVVVTQAGSPARSSMIAVSPDGRQIAFTAGGAGGPSLYVRSLDSPEARPISGTLGAAFPVFSPDGRRLAFMHQQRLKHVAIEGGTPQAIADMRNPRSAAAWSTDDTLLFHPDYRSPLMRVSAAGGTPVEVLPVAADNVAWFSPQFLPGGRRFLVVRFPYSDRVAEGAGIYLGSLDSPDLSLLVPGRISEVSYGDGEIFYRRGTDLIAQTFDAQAVRVSGEPRVIAPHVSMSAAAAGTLIFFDPPGGLSLGYAITLLSRSGQIVSRVGESGTFRDPSFSPDGRHLAIARADEHGLFSIWTYDLARKIDTRITPATFVSPAWTRDSRAVIAGGSSGLYRWDLGGSGEGRLLRSWKEFGNVNDVTADGRHALVHIIGTASARHDLVALDGASEPRMAVPAQAVLSAATAAFAPNGKWIVAVSPEGSTRRLYAFPYPASSAGRIAVSAEQALHPRWRKDGGELYFLRPTGLGSDMMVVPVTWKGDEPDFGTASVLFNLPRLVTGNRGFDVTADGQTFAVVQAEESPTAPLSVRLRVKR